MPSPPFGIGLQMLSQDFQCLLLPFGDEPQKKFANDFSNNLRVPEWRGAVDNE